MSVRFECPACEMGDHLNHVEHWDRAPAGLLGGAHCSCKGDCTPPDLSWLGQPFVKRGNEL